MVVNPFRPISRRLRIPTECRRRGELERATPRRQRRGEDEHRALLHRGGAEDDGAGKLARAGFGEDRRVAR